MAAEEALTLPPRQLFTLPDGRKLSYLVFGSRLPGPAASSSSDATTSAAASSGKPVIVFLHGTPASAGEAASLHEAAAAAGVSVVSVDRPGIAGSSPMPSKGPQLSFASFAADLGAFIDGLKLGQVALIGESGGGSYAAAAAAILGRSKVGQLHLIAGVGPLAGEGALPMDSLAGFDRFSIAWTRGRVGSAAVWAAHRLFRWFLQRYPAKVLDAAAGDLGPVDAAAFKERPEMGRLFCAIMGAAYEQGVGGVLADYRALGSPFKPEVDVGSIKCRATVWQGTEDRCVPLSHAEWYAANIPGATLRVMQGEGHITVSLRHAGEIVAAVLEGAGAAPPGGS